jgi:ABC-type ATPase with predicted acetyltransferase domain
MAEFKCDKCGAKKECRCKPKTCEKCGASGTMVKKA